jgi:hypothetical protein
MQVSVMKTLVRGVCCSGLVSWPLMAADVAADSGAGNFYALVFGLMATLFGGMAICYGLVKLAEKIMHSLAARHPVPASVPPIRHAA